MKYTLSLTALLLATLPLPALAIDGATATRVDGKTIKLDWTGAKSVDIFRSTDPAATVDKATAVKADDRDGTETVSADSATRLYFLVRDRATGKAVRVAEREVPLERGSNFRDLGGYPAAEGKTVKWGRIFRSGAMPLLTEADYARLAPLDIRTIVDLRSLEEREIAPTLLDDRTGALFVSNDYAMSRIMPKPGPSGEMVLPDNLYAGIGTMLRPQLRATFRRLLADDGGLVYNCSAGQDRTGITSALILTALGVPRDVIMTDYHLSTALRRPENEMPKVDPADYPHNLVLQYYAKAMAKPGGARPEPLYARDGEAYLAKFFRGLEADHGSVEAYMAKELEMTPDKVARLRALYLE